MAAYSAGGDTISELQFKYWCASEFLQIHRFNSGSNLGELLVTNNIPMVKCDFCGSQGKVEIVQQDNGKIKFSVRCTGCGNAHQTVTPSGQQAILRWNAINPKGLRYVDFPMFGLSNLTPQDAKTRMIGIRRNLEVRENLAALESTLNPVLGKRPPGKEYRKRLKMYVQWALWALTAIKTELEQ